VIVVVALLGILLVAAVPQLFVPDELDVEVTARQVASDLGLARRLAIARRVVFLVTFTPAGGPYTAYSVGAIGSPVPEPGFPKDLPTQVTVTGAGIITFQPSGAATAAALLTFQTGGATAQVDVVRTTGRTRVTGP
jgi:hypothetical protein